MVKRYGVCLEQAERVCLQALVKEGKTSVRMLRRANILLLADAGQMDFTIAVTLHVSLSTVARARRRYVQEGFEAALRDRPQPAGRSKLTADQQALLLSVARSDPPPGVGGWSPRKLAARLVELNVGVSISRETVRKILQKHCITLGRGRARK